MVVVIEPYTFLPPSEAKQASKKAKIHRGAKDHINIRILHAGSQQQKSMGIADTMVCRTLMYMWAFGHLAPIQRCFVGPDFWS